MSKLKDYPCRICIYHQWKIYKLFTVGYYQDGGYFITDLSQTSWYTYIASKIHLSWKNKIREPISIPTDMENTYSILLNNPKISHHIDWNAHISWTGIISWYYEDGSPKWLSIKSWDLHWYNDGWPMFGFNFWLKILEDFPEIKMDDSKLFKKYHLIINGPIIVDLRKDSTEDFDYIIEGYYIHKNHLPKDMQDWMLIPKLHPTYGLVWLVPIHSPIESPYIFWILCIKDPLCNNSECFSYAGAPWVINEDWSWDLLCVYLTKEDTTKFVTLDKNNSP